MRNQFDNYEKKIMEKLDREAEEIERRIGEDPRVAEAKADEGLDRKVYARVAAYEEAVLSKNSSGTDGMVRAEGADIAEVAKLARLSEEDTEALRLGRELQKRRKEEEGRKEAEGKTRKYAGKWKRIVAAAAVLVLVAGAGVNGIGGPNRVVKIMKQIVGSREVSKISSSSGEVKQAGDVEEVKAYQRIKDELDINPVRIRLIDRKMKYKCCEIDSEIRLAQLLYVFGDRNISYLICDSYTKETKGSDIEDVKLDEFVYTEGQLEAEIIEYELPDSKERKYSAVFEYRGIYYQLTGTMKWDDFEKILKNLHFPV